MLSPNDFKNFVPEKDPYFNDIPRLKLDDLRPRYDGKPFISILISTYNRGAQLARTLETLARQKIRDFEILLNDSDSTQDLKHWVEVFDPYLNINYFHTKRKEWLSCGSTAYKMMLPYAKGEIITIMHPEMMLDESATEFIINALLGASEIDGEKYTLLKDKPIDGNAYTEEDMQNKISDWYWVSLRPGFFIQQTYPFLNLADWHSKVNNLQNTPGYREVCGFAGRPNTWHATCSIYPWWFVGSAYKDCPIWEDMPEFKGHASLDMWMMNYRMAAGIVDIVPNKVMCYHQPHQTFAVAPIGEEASSREDAKIKGQKVADE